MTINKLPGPWRITFDTNPDDCNILCIMCERYNNFKKKSSTNEKIRMDSLLIEEVVEQGFQLGELKEIIPSTMGEPLLYDYFDKFIELCEKYNLYLNLTTNGTFPKKPIEDWANLLLPICSDIKISWNGFTKETDEKIMHGKNHDLAKDNLIELLRIRDELRRNGKKCSSITLQLTFMEMNYQEIPDIVEMAIDYGIDRVKGHHIWIHNKEAEKWSMRRNKDSINRWNDVSNKTQNLVNNIKMETGKSIKIENIYPLSDKKPNSLLLNSVCPFLGREAWVAANGNFNPCCAPDDLRRNLGNFGNLHNSSLKEIWNSSEYNELCKSYEKNILCKRCNMRKNSKDVYKYGY
ncbi:MAG: SPASM domain-containing protein [Candidatus Heimdallarchaeota archaeon]